VLVFFGFVVPALDTGVACSIGFMGGNVKVMAGLDEVLLCLA